MSTKIAIFNSNGSFYNFYPNLPKISVIHKMSLYLRWAPFKYPKWKFASEIVQFCNCTHINPTHSSISKWANFKLAKWVKLKSIFLKSRKWMFLTFEPTIVAKTNVTVLQSPSTFIQRTTVNDWTADEWDTELFATLQHWIGGKEDNKNIKVDLFGVTFDVV